MSDTTFLSKVTSITTGWLQDINNFFYRITSGTAKTTPTGADMVWLWDSVANTWKTFSITNLLSYLNSTGYLSTSPSIGVGYTTGAGGGVTQITSKATGVTLNKRCGVITTHNASLAAGAIVSFKVTNSTIGIYDTVLVTSSAGTSTYGAYEIWASDIVSVGFNFTVNIKNVTGGPLSEVIFINFALISGSQS